MNTHKFIYTLVGFILINLLSLHSYAYTTGSTTEKLVKSITSVAVAKSKLRAALTGTDSCQVGSCINYYTTYICEIVAALDVKVNGAIIGDMTGSKPDFKISANDLRHMKKLFAQCKPTNYQYWNYNSVLHVGYSPSNKADAKIRKYLGVKRK